MAQDKKINRAQIAAIMALWHPYRVRLLMDCCGISYGDIASRLGCTRENVTQALAGKYYSERVMGATHSLLHEAMGADCPLFDELFSDHPQAAKKCA